VQQVELLKAGKGHLYLYGQSDYYDIFSQKPNDIHTTEWCGIFPGTINDSEIVACDEFNNSN
jgi:hypothetical protein